MTATAIDTETFTAEWQQWHREHEANRADRHGFLAITGLHWLDETPQTFDDAPGAWSTGPNGIVVDLGGAELEIDDVTVRGVHCFGVLAERASVYPKWGDAVIEVAKRGGHDIVRPRHPDAPRLTSYRGTLAYPADPRWVVPASFRAFDRPRPTTVGAAVDDLEHVYDAPGEVRFRVGDDDVTLTVFPGHGDTMMVLFTDATSGITTYAANRVLAIDRPDADGNVTLDFNRAVNLPCAYTPLATCPLPPTENRLAVAIHAGEQTPILA